MSTILKWAGNKTAIMPELKKYLPAGPRLVEPFAGSWEGANKFLI